MTHWYFDFISPFAYLQWPRIRALSTEVPIQFRPVLLAGILNHHGQKGPAEIPSKRLFTYRHVLWKAERCGVPLVFPPTHPFNPLAALRLCAAAGSSAHVIEALFQHIWREGQAASTAADLAPVAERLGLDSDQALSDPDAKARLREHFHDAVGAGVFGVPSLVHDGQLFWGEDATDMFEDCIAGSPFFSRSDVAALETIPVGAARRI